VSNNVQLDYAGAESYRPWIRAVAVAQAWTRLAICSAALLFVLMFLFSGSAFAAVDVLVLLLFLLSWFVALIGTIILAILTQSGGRATVTCVVAFVPFVGLIGFVGADLSAYEYLRSAGFKAGFFRPIPL
jgi:hypothetical protein